MKENQLDAPAFPITSCAEHQFIGMTLRDYFAAKALAAMLANPNKEGANCGSRGA